jgi:hypothetical protein
MTHSVPHMTPAGAATKQVYVFANLLQQFCIRRLGAPMFATFISIRLVASILGEGAQRRLPWIGTLLWRFRCLRSLWHVPPMHRPAAGTALVINTCATIPSIEHVASSSSNTPTSPIILMLSLSIYLSTRDLDI